jgi:hypothetical protein
MKMSPSFSRHPPGRHDAMRQQLPTVLLRYTCLSCTVAYTAMNTSQQVLHVWARTPKVWGWEMLHQSLI